MKKLTYISLLAIVFIAISSCKNKNTPEVKTVSNNIEQTTKKPLNPNATYAKVEFSVDGMTCAMGCAKTIEKKIAKMEGVKTVKVDFDKRLAMVEYDKAKVTPKSLEETVTKAGEVYKVKEMKIVETFSTEKDNVKAKCDETKCKNKKGKKCDEACMKKCEAKKTS